MDGRITKNELEVQSHNNINAFEEQERTQPTQMDYTQGIHRALAYR